MKNILNKHFFNGDWGLGIGDWGLGIGPNPQSPIPNPQSPCTNSNKINKHFHVMLYYIIVIEKINSY